MIRESPAWRERDDLLHGAPGVGTVLAGGIVGGTLYRWALGEVDRGLAGPTLPWVTQRGPNGLTRW